MAAVFSQTRPVVFRVIRRRLLRGLRSSTDSEDIAQSVWRSLFTHCDKSFATRSEFFRFAGWLAYRKTVDRGRMFNVRRHTECECDPDTLDEYLSSGSPPDEAAEVKELQDCIVDSMPSRFKHAIRLRIDGGSIGEIATELHIPRRSLYRALEAARSTLGEALGAE